MRLKHLSFAWLDDTPYVTVIDTMDDGQPSLRVLDSRESLKAMHAWIVEAGALIDEGVSG